MNFRTTLVILVVFVLLAGAYFLFGRPNPDAEKLASEQQKIREVYGLKKDAIRQIRLSFKAESYQPLTLAKGADGGWQLTSPFAADADSRKVDEMLGDLLEKKVKRTLDTTDLVQYGLQPPKIQIELWTTGESPAKTFLIGNKTINYSVYTKEKSETQVFLIESSALDDFTKAPSDLRDRDILSFSPNAVSEISIQVSGRPAIHCRKGDADEWEMFQPVSTKADAGEIASILSALDSLRVAVFEADGQIDLTPYGLDKPRMIIGLRLSDNNREKLLVGNEAGTTGRIYVKRSDTNSIYAVNGEIYAELNKTVFDLRDKRVIDFQRTAINRFEIRQGEKTIVCQEVKDGEWEIKEPVALKADAAAVDDLLFGVDALKAVEFVDDQPKSLQPYGLDTPSIQVSFMAPDAEPAILLVGKADGDKVYVKSQRAASVFLVKKDLLDLVGMGIAGLRTKQILDFSSDDAVKLVLKHGDVDLTCQKQGTNWRLTRPVQEDANTRVVNNIIDQVNPLTVERFLAGAPASGTTGLDAPEVRLAITLKDRTEHTLSIGKPADEKHYYARLLKAPDSIFLLKSELVQALKKTVEDLRATPDGA